MKDWLTQLMLVSLAVTGARADWTVPSEPLPLQIEVEGTVEISRSSVQTIRSGSVDAIVSWIGPDGKHAEFGDLLMRLDTSPVRRRHAAKLDRLMTKRGQATNEIMALERTLAEAEEDLAVKVANLRVRAAEARRAGRADSNQVATLVQGIESAERQASLQQVELKRMQNLFQLGELSRIELEDAELAAAAAKRAVILAELAVEDIGDGSDPVLARRAEWQVERALRTLGVDKDGEIVEDQGYGKKIAALRKKLARTRSTLAEELAVEEAELLTVARAAWSHLPIQELRILQDGKLLHQLFGTNAEARATYTPARRHGWIETPTTARSEQALVIRGEAQWRIDLPPGTYQTEWRLGDAAEWSCMSAKAGEQVLIAENRLAAKEVKTYQAEVVVGDGGLLLDIGLADKAILASAAGAVKNQSWISLGREIRSNVPAVYLTPTAQLVINLRVHHLQASFFETNQAAVSRIEIKTSDGAWVPAGAITVNEDPVPFYPVPDTHRRGPSEENPQEKTARAVTVSVPAEHSDKFAFAAHAACRAIVRPQNGAVLVPAWLVQQAKTGLFVMRGGVRQAIRATRFDRAYLVTEGVAIGDVLQPPTAVEETAGANRFTGEVIAGDASPVSLEIDSWARISELLPHGSKVKKGEVVMTLYRPEENDRMRRAKSNAGKAKSGYQSAQDTQQAEFLRQTGEQAQALQEEKLAADQVAEAYRIDLAELAGADEEERAAAEELALLEQRVAQLEGQESARLQYDDYRRQRDTLRLQAQLQAINKIATFRQTDYTQVLDNRFAWRRARNELKVREGKLALMLKQQEVMSQSALNQLEDGVEDVFSNYDFEKVRFVKAPADGNVFFKNGYNDMTKRRERMDKEFVVWGGLLVAEVMDVENMLFKVSLPEQFYSDMNVGTALPIELEDLGDRQLDGQIVTKGQSLKRPSSQQEAGAESISLRRVFDVTLSFAVPDDLKESLRPGLRGAVVLP